MLISIAFFGFVPMRLLLFYTFCIIAIESFLKQPAALFQCGDNIAEIATFIEGLIVGKTFT